MEFICFSVFSLLPLALVLGKADASAGTQSNVVVVVVPLLSLSLPTWPILLSSPQSNVFITNSFRSSLKDVARNYFYEQGIKSTKVT